jgi:hypothetical protein
VTVLLLVSPVQSLTSIKETLLAALKSRQITEIHGVPVPNDPSEIEFGLPRDRNNLEKGWRKLKPPPQQNGDARRQGAGKRSTAITDSPQGADMRDFQAVAFRFRKTSAAGEQTGEDDELAMEIDDPGWDVLISKYDDETDEDNP